MDHGVTFIGIFRIADHAAWLPAIQRMSAFVEANVPGARSFNAFATADGSEGIVVYSHPDGDSFDQHLAAAATLIEAGTEMVEVTAIRLLGSVNPETVERLRASGAPVTVLQPVSGFERD